jgi:hypothetical protein
VAVKSTFPKITTSKCHNTIQNNAKTYIPKRFNILTVSKTMKRIKRTKKVPGMERQMHKRTK